MATACSSAEGSPATPWGKASVWALGYLLLRTVLAPLAPIPGVLFLDPIAALLPLAVSRGGRAAGILLPAAVLCADLLGSLDPASTVLRAGMVAVVATRVWHNASPRHSWELATLLASWQGCVIAWSGNYPFVYVSAISLLQASLWIVAFTPRFPRPTHPGARFWILAASLVAMALLARERPFPLPRLGQSSGTGVCILATLLALGLTFRPAALRTPSRPARKAARSSGSASSWSALGKQR